MNIGQQALPGGAYLVQVEGRLDQGLNPQLEEALNVLLQEGHTRLIVDLSQTNYINSGGLRCLVSAWRQARQQDGNLVLCGLNGRLQEIFSMVGFDRVFKIYVDCRGAQQAMQL